MQRFYKLGKCDWCSKVTNVFMTSFESDSRKYMCDHCKAFLNDKYLKKDGIENYVDLWDETSPLDVPSQPISTQFLTTQRPNEFIIKQSEGKKVVLYGYHDQKRFLVKVNNPKSLFNKEREFEYFHLAPASRRFSSEVKKLSEDKND